jgi:hypothetical protein
MLDKMELLDRFMKLLAWQLALAIVLLMELLLYNGLRIKRMMGINWPFAIKPLPARNTVRSVRNVRRQEISRHAYA